MCDFLRRCLYPIGIIILALIAASDLPDVLMPQIVVLR